MQSSLLQSVADTRNWRLSWSLMVALVLAKLWLVSDQMLLALADNSHDDLLFVQLANELAQLQWLGPYNNLTLAKGPFYPLWIAFAFLAGVPLLLSEHLLYIAACLITERALQPLIASRLLRTVIFVLLLFNPATFTWQLTRVLRDGLYPGLTLLVVGSAIGLLVRRHEPAQNLVGWAAMCGLATAALWLTREEGVWILPFLAPLLIWTLASVVLSDRRDWRKIITILLPLLLPIVAIQAVSMANLAHYGIYAIVEFKTPAFKAAYGALTRVRPVEHKPQVPVQKETRLRIYQQSAAFGELQPFLERDKFWTFPAVGLENHPSGSNEIGGGWFMWALRDAVAEAGYFRSGLQAAGFFQRLANEINTACQEQRLDCLAQRASLMPPWRSEYLVPVIEKIMFGFTMLATFSRVSPDPIPSNGSPAHLVLFQDLTREQPSGRDTTARGWVVHASGRPLTVALVEPDTNRIVSPARFYSSPDVYQFFFLRANQNIASANNARFEVRGRCVRTCLLRISDEGRTLADISLKNGPASQFIDPLWAFIDETSSDTLLPSLARLAGLKLSLMEKIAVAYQLTIPCLAMTALAAISFWLFQSIRNRTFTAIGLIAASIAAAVCLRLLILAIIDVTSFKAVDVVYMSPLYPLFLLCCCLFIIEAAIVSIAKIRK
ncbi:MAG TPA: hypothetical protein P5330_01095 [Candidatus Competibacteraceae bacterium]|nr:hypothetical protein [Candidatus Competibacteraceae bacterium]